METLTLGLLRANGVGPLEGIDNRDYGRNFERYEDKRCFRHHESVKVVTPRKFR